MRRHQFRLRTLVLTVLLAGLALGFDRGLSRATPAQLNGVAVALLGVVYSLAMLHVLGGGSRPSRALRRRGRGRGAKLNLDDRTDRADCERLEEKAPDSTIFLLESSPHRR